MIELTGFDTAEVDFVLDAQAEANAPDCNVDDEVPPIPDSGDAVTQPGDLWLLGPHRLLCADATIAESYERLLDGDRAALIFADSPYNVPIEGPVSRLGKARHREFAMASGEMTSDQFSGFLETAFTHMATHSADGAIHFICMDWRHMGETLAAEKTGRRTRLLELDPLYCDTIVRRWQAFTVKRARHADGGLSFEEMEEQRSVEANPTIADPDDDLLAHVEGKHRRDGAAAGQEVVSRNQ